MGRRVRFIGLVATLSFSVTLGLSAYASAQVVDPVKPVADGLATNFLPYALALVGFALLAVVRYAVLQNTEHAKALADINVKHTAEVAAEREKHSAALAAVQAQLIEQLRTDAKEQRELLMQIVPLAGKLTEGLEIIESLSKGE